jgi:DNA-directed RNA polymerase subunit E'/Rpb7
MASSTELFVPIKFKTTVQLKPNEVGPNIEEIIYTKLKNNLENMCSKHGYIKRNSIKVVKRSIGHIKIPHFNGQIVYELQCVAEICNPAQGSIIKCRVKAKNSMGLLAEGLYDNIPILEVIVPKISAGIQSEVNIDTVSIGDDINIEVCGKKLLLYDKHISIIGKIIKDKIQYVKNELNEDKDEEYEGKSDMLGGDPDIVDEVIIEDGDEEDAEEEEEEEEDEEDVDDENLSEDEEEEFDDGDELEIEDVPEDVPEDEFHEDE